MGSRVTLQLVGGGSTRVALPFAPTGPLATAAIEALHAVLPADTYWALYARWLTEGGAYWVFSVNCRISANCRSGGTGGVRLEAAAVLMHFIWRW